MLVSGVPARARRIRRRLAARCCRHKVAFPQSAACSFIPSQPPPGRLRNDESRMSPSPQPIAGQGTGWLAGAGRRFRRDVGGRNTISTPLQAQDWRRPGGRSPRSAPWRAASATRQNRPPSRRLGRPQGSPRGPAASGIPGSCLTAPRPAQGRRGAHNAGPSRSGLRPTTRLGPCSGRGSWQPPFCTVKMPGPARLIIYESTPAAPRRKQATRARPITRTDQPPLEGAAAGQNGHLAQADRRLVAAPASLRCWMIWRNDSTKLSSL